MIVVTKRKQIALVLTMVIVVEVRMMAIIMAFLTIGKLLPRQIWTATKSPTTTCPPP